ncbi:hypothetical protein [Psychromarinibacter sp. S121]|uniref:hypothetical protein n=1 Tax=Psychromarinibacter sp. S121 TaxID=3415127 RepID=UPI003C7D98BA
MNQVYSINRNWSNRFIPEIQRIVGAHLLSVAPDNLDMYDATDLLMMEARDLRIAARVRRPGYADAFPFDFTIRAQVPSGKETELSKIVNGKGDWMFYGHADTSGHKLASWWLIDLRAFRAGLIRQATNGHPIRCGDRTNPDGTRFKWFDIRSFPSNPPLVVASRR